MINYLADRLDGINYTYSDATGEWNGTANSISNIDCEGQNTCVQEDPIYRTDIFDCFTLVNLIIAVLNSNNLSEFKENIVKTSYGAYYLTENKNLLTTISYFNRNHFTIPDWTNVNAKYGFISNFADPINENQQINLKSTLTRSNWFIFNLDNPDKSDKILASEIRVFNDELGNSALKYFKDPDQPDSLQSILDKNPDFKSTQVITNYIPTKVAIDNIETIPTPSVVGIVRDPVKWNIKKLIGTEYTLSHVGIAYKKTFDKDQFIYRDMVCSTKRGDNPRDCKVTNNTCGDGEFKLDKNNQCKIIMLLNATSAYPDDYYFYAKSDNMYACTKDRPSGSNIITTCNRVMSLPLKSYLEKNQNISSVLGIHVENIL
ncbi:MAG: DUF1460 domain-containing protein [Silvanigrellaceae bacterium]|nr:DUF1460 domain-containing protein [Silvanigrellaceae bacterium]